jgi:hypothetical protein
VKIPVARQLFSNRTVEDGSEVASRILWNVGELSKNNSRPLP